MPVNQRVLSDKYNSIDIQHAHTAEIERLEKELVKLNNIPGYKRPIGFDMMKKDIVEKINKEKSDLQKEANIGRRLTRQLGLSPEAEPTEKTKEMLKRAKKLGVTDPTRGYLDEHGQALPARHEGHPFPPRAERNAGHILADQLDSVLSTTSSYRHHPGGGYAGGGVSGAEYLPHRR